MPTPSAAQRYNFYHEAQSLRLGGGLAAGMAREALPPLVLKAAAHAWSDELTRVRGCRHCHAQYCKPQARTGWCAQHSLTVMPEAAGRCYGNMQPYLYFNRPTAHLAGLQLRHAGSVQGGTVARLQQLCSVAREPFAEENYDVNMRTWPGCSCDMHVASKVAL